MSDIYIPESDMTFGPFKKDKVFHIEKSTVYSSMKSQIPISEFILMDTSCRKPQMLVIEAKKSSPQPGNVIRFDDFISEMKNKFINSFSLAWACALKRHPAQHTDTLPTSFQNIDFSTTEVKFILVINGHKEEWLPPLADALKKALHETIKAWAFTPLSVVVCNPEMAQRKGLLTAPHDRQCSQHSTLQEAH